MADVSSRVFTTVLDLHDRIYKSTNGWVGHRLLYVRTLLLHAVGAKTGQVRTNALTYARDGENYLLVPSNGGAARWPAWYHNLKANPDVTINVGRRRFAVHASFVEPGDPDFDRLWDVVNHNNSNRYRAYQKKTERQLPVIVLSPR